MSLLAGLADKLVGGLAGSIVDVVKTYWPPELSPEQKAEMTVAIERLAIEKERDVNNAIEAAERRLTERIALLEGTASDLRAVPWIGPAVLFLRGLQRPIWGYATLYVNLMWFSGKWGSLSQTQESAIWIINFLVLGFLFGERAIQNVAPLLTELMHRKNKP